MQEDIEEKKRREQKKKGGRKGGEGQIGNIESEQKTNRVR